LEGKELSLNSQKLDYKKKIRERQKRI
jgi:hypothetical protein